ncbi:vWA domain-containing protein [Bacillus mesophilum]|uniref:VWA domain-containing protein n=1 Tax=Bacillus mesophilum TaxID=1071718 RepID=A0A7V7UWX0_9BACI|nr:BatA and WFA domain-containing protein [Bacillus mesophilum]KAB2335391.1 VWA domain-containing protein [Bacillus mesophilum]
MQFISPLYFSLILFLGAVILFYFFRKQYTEKSVSSNMLWQQTLNEWQASPFLKKMQQNLLFWLQILALLLLMLALSGPVFKQNAVVGDDVIFVIDSSASMSADFQEKDRFTAAKNEMLQIIDILNGQNVTIIQAGQQPQILLNKESNKSHAEQVVTSLELTYDHESMNEALRLANSLAGEGSAIHIFSDNVEEELAADELPNRYVQVHNIGENDVNLSLISFGVTYTEGRTSGVAVIENQSDEKQNAEFAILGEEQQLFQQSVEIEAGEREIIQVGELKELPLYEGVISTKDAYSADNQLTAVLSSGSPQVYSLGETSSFAVRGFETIGAEVIQAAVGEWDQDNRQGIILAEGDTLEELPNLPAIYFHSSTEKLELNEAITIQEDQLLQFVDHDSLYIGQASKPLEGNWETIMQSGNHPLIQKGSHNGQPIIIVNFSLSDSDWPLHPGFPIFLFNAYEWLSQETDFLGYYQPGEEKWLNVSNAMQSIDIFNIEDENLYSLNLENESFRAPVQPGSYQAVSQDHIYHFAVALDEREKQITSGQSFTLNERTLEAKQASSVNESLWFWLALIALVFIAIEWEVYRRGHRV